MRGTDTLTTDIEKYVMQGYKLPKLGELSRTKTGVDQFQDENLKLIKKGMKYSQAVARDPGSSNTKKEMMLFRPPRKHRTDVLYLWGRAGTGKSTSIYNTLTAFRNTYGHTFYCKTNG